MAPRSAPKSPSPRTIKATPTTTVPQLRKGMKTAQQMNIVRKLIRAVVEGKKLMQFIGSEPGMGKTYIVMDELKRCGIRAEKAGPSGVDNFVNFLWANRNAPVIVFDDCDKLLRSETIANIAKKAWDGDRKVIHRTLVAKRNERRPNEADEDFKDRHDPHQAPQEFKIKPRLIWLTNIDHRKKNILDEKMVGHFKALISRGLAPFYVNTDDVEDVFCYVLELATNGKMLINLNGKDTKKGTSMTVDKAEQAIAWFIEHRNSLREISPRSMRIIGEQFRIADSAEEADELLRYSELDPEVKRAIPEYTFPVFHRGVYEEMEVEENGKKKKKKVCVTPGYWIPAVRKTDAAARKGFKPKGKK